MYECEKELPKSEAHNIPLVEAKLKQEWLKNPFALAHEHDRLVAPGGHRAESNRDQVVFRQVEGDLALTQGAKEDGRVLVAEARTAVDAIRKKDPKNYELPQLEIVQKRLEAQLKKASDSRFTSFIPRGAED